MRNFKLSNDIYANERHKAEVSLILKRNKNTRNAFKITHHSMYFTPHVLLKPYISHYRISFPGNPSISDKLTIIPDASGCLIFTLTGNALQSTFWGVTTETVVVKNDTNDCHMRLFVEFLPLGLFYFTGIPQSELTDRKMSLCQINNHIHTQVERALEVALDVDVLIQKIDEIFLPYLMGKEYLPTLLDAMLQLKQSSGTVTVGELSRSTCYSERHLNRIFQEHMGMSAKTFSKIIRINTSILRMKQHGSKLTSLAQDMGFCDQSHFIRDFKSVCKVTPKEYIVNMSDFYNEGFKF
jgi:AraC-like DNA-binding protein